jgi:nicotinamidase-related amidase
MVKRGPHLRPQASEGEVQHGPFFRSRRRASALWTGSLQKAWRRALVPPDSLSQGGRSGSLAEPKKTRVELSAHAGTSEESQFVPNLAPRDDEIVLCKTTDSALTGTNLRLILRT